MLPDVPRDFATINDPGSRFLAEVAYMWLTMRETGRAMRVFEALSQLFPGHYLPVLGQAECHLDFGDGREAANKARQSLVLTGHSCQTMAWVLYIEGKACIYANRRADALRAFQQAAEMDPQGSVGRLASQMAAALDPDQAGKERAT